MTVELFSWPSRSSDPEHEPIDILVFCDGTGKNGREDAEQTNIYRLYCLLGQMPTRKPQPGQHRRKRKLQYIPGVGAEDKGIPKYLAQVFGKAIVENVIKAYMFICENYRPGDNVCLFGYSRGAFVARKVAGLLNRIGIVGHREELLDQWKRCEKPVPWDQLVDTSKPVPVKCIGVWDTVGAIYGKGGHEITNLLGIPDTELSPNIELALHVCAFHENRRRFRVTLFEPNQTTTLKEVWFPGAHSDVGGGGEKPTLMPRLSLIWMIGELQSFLEIADEKLKYPSLSKLEPMDAYNESPAWKRVVDKLESRLESRALTPKSKLHQTVQQIKHAGGARTPGQVLLTLSELITSLQLNIRICLTDYNRLEVIKRAIATERKVQREQEVSHRRRLESLPSLPSHVSPQSPPPYSPTPSYTSLAAPAPRQLTRLAIPEHPYSSITDSPIVGSPMAIKSADKPRLSRNNHRKDSK
ncbi:hypothetical protein RhiJN_00180 [Ceratobasidium sp. AG-Ba]|nr:hypothetical protein RhiJN_00180 [Ceratobasidium sp. AG-Ba]QRW01213.1 hypothetical protein RhiLY_00210 [Ceratobasidium sp. AG-Ba]